MTGGTTATARMSSCTAKSDTAVAVAKSSCTVIADATMETSGTLAAAADTTTEEK